MSANVLFTPAVGPELSLAPENVSSAGLTRIIEAEGSVGHRSAVALPTLPVLAAEEFIGSRNICDAHVRAVVFNFLPGFE